MRDNAQNPVEENGLGGAAMLVLGERLAVDIHSGKLKLKHTVILAAVDASLQKYVRTPAHHGELIEKVLKYGHNFRLPMASP